MLIAAGILGLVTISDGFLYLGLQRQADLDTTLFPLLFTATSFAYMVLACRWAGSPTASAAPAPSSPAT